MEAMELGGATTYNILVQEMEATLRRSSSHCLGHDNGSANNMVQSVAHPELTGGMIATSSPSLIKGSSAPPSTLSPRTST